MNTPGFTVELPPEWQTADIRPGFTRVIAAGKLSQGRECLLVQGLLKDGTVFMAVTWDGGQRLARTSPDTNWATQERYSGKPRSRADARVIDRAWRVAVDVLAESRKATAEQMNSGWEPPPSVAVLNSPEMMDRAYEAYCEKADEPVSRELFEQGIEILAAADMEAEPDR